MEGKRVKSLIPNDDQTGIGEVVDVDFTEELQTITLCRVRWPDGEVEVYWHTDLEVVELAKEEEKG